MASLNPKSLCRNYSLEQIETKIAFYQNALDGATVEEYSKDSSQGSQRVRSARIENIAEQLQAWLAAKECKTGVGGVKIVSTNFTDRRRAGII